MSPAARITGSPAPARVTGVGCNVAVGGRSVFVAGATGKGVLGACVVVGSARVAGGVALLVGMRVGVLEGGTAVGEGTLVEVGN